MDKLNFNDELFDYDNEDNEEQQYYFLLILLLQQFYDDYKTKTPTYIVEHIDEDSKKLQKDMVDKVNYLDDKYKEWSKTFAKENGILEGNLNKVKIAKDYDEKRDLMIKEQKQTIKNIVNELSGQLKSSSLYFKALEVPEKLDVRKQVGKAVNRVKRLVNKGVQTVKRVAIRGTAMFLFKEPYLWWITKKDKNVCPTCRYYEAHNPYPLKEAPYHTDCMCRCSQVITAGNDKDGIVLSEMYTDDARKLLQYDI